MYQTGRGQGLGGGAVSGSGASREMRMFQNLTEMMVTSLYEYTKNH